MALPPPDKKRWSLFLSNFINNSNSGLVLEMEKGRFISPPESNGGGARGEEQDWRRFREAGFLDETEFWKKDRETVVERIQQLEKELYDYQYNMGLLLLEKEKWTSEYKKIREALEGTKGMLKRQETAHLITVLDLEKQEQNLQKALGAEKQRIKDLEKALKEMSAEYAVAKLTSGKKLAENQALEIIIEDKYLEIRGKLHSADAKLAEASRRSTEVDIKLQEVEARERRLQKGFSIFMKEKQEHEEDLLRQREHLQSWEKKLLEFKENLVEGQCFSREGGDNTVEGGNVVNRKEVVEEERNINVRLQTLAARDKEVDIKLMNLEKKERDFLIIEENLAARERVEIQRLLDDNQKSLHCKKQDFELELDKRRQSFEEDLKGQLDDVDKKKKELDSREDQILMKELALESKIELLKDKEKNIDEKARDLKGREEFINIAEEKLKDEKGQLAEDTRKPVTCKDELESSSSAMNDEEKKISREKESIVSLQEVKRKLEDCRIMKDILSKETEDLRLEKNKFQKDREALDERRTVLTEELKKLTGDKERFQDWRCTEEDKLRKASLEMTVNIQRELEELSLKKEMLEKEHADFARKLECNLQIKLEEKLREVDNEFERREKQKVQEVDTVQNSLANERENFVKERRHFLAEAEKYKICKNSGFTVNELKFLGIRTPSRTDVAGSQVVSRGGHMSMPQKCSMLFDVPPGDGANLPIQDRISKSFDSEASEGETNYGADTVQSDNETKCSVVSERLVKAGKERETTFRLADSSSRAMEGEPNIFSFDKRDEGSFKTSPTKHREGHQISRKRRLETMAVVEDAKAILGKRSEDKEQLENKEAELSENLVDIDDKRQGDFVYGDEMETSAGQQQQFGQVRNEKLDSEKEKVVEIPLVHHKKHRTSPGTLSTGEKRYNFRLSTIQSRLEVEDKMQNPCFFSSELDEEEENDFTSDPEDNDFTSDEEEDNDLSSDQEEDNDFVSE